MYLLGLYHLLDLCNSCNLCSIPILTLKRSLYHSRGRLRTYIMVGSIEIAYFTQLPFIQLHSALMALKSAYVKLPSIVFPSATNASLV